MMSGSRPIDVRAVLRAGVRVVGIYGADDRRFHSSARYLRSIGVPVKMIRGASHFPFVERPDGFHRTIDLFLGERAAVPNA